MNGWRYLADCFPISLRRKLSNVCFRFLVFPSSLTHPPHLSVEASLTRTLKSWKTASNTSPTPNADDIGEDGDIVMANPLADQEDELWQKMARMNWKTYTEWFTPMPTDLVRGSVRGFPECKDGCGGCADVWSCRITCRKCRRSITFWFAPRPASRKSVVRYLRLLLYVFRLLSLYFPRDIG